MHQSKATHYNTLLWPLTVVHTSPSPKRALWGSRFAFVMAVSGAAVGLGNLWKFPYLAGTQGGGAFVLLYLLFTLLISMPALIAELLLGKLGRRNAVTTLEQIARSLSHSPRWKYVGWLGALTLLFILSFYSVVGGWSLFYLLRALQAPFTTGSVFTVWEHLQASPLTLLFWYTLFLLLTLGIVTLGVTQGLERLSKGLMPLLFLLLILLASYACLEGDHQSALRFLFSFPPTVTPQIALYALGQACFSLATGAGAMVVYGSYLPKNTSLLTTTATVSLLNIGAALLAGLAIFPLLFAYHLSPEDGPGLLFQIMPLAFSHMPGAPWLAPCFFLLLFFAAWTSSISMGEPLVAILQERRLLSRSRSSFYIGLLSWTIGLGTLFSFNLFKEVRLFRRWDLFQIFVDFPSNFLLPLGALLFCFFVGWKMPDPLTRSELHPKSASLYFLWRLAICYLVPTGITLVLLSHFF